MTDNVFEEQINTLNALTQKANRLGLSSLSLECPTLVDYYLSISGNSKDKFTADQKDYLFSELNRLDFKQTFDRKEILEWFEKRI